jgi:uncharacterized membrane protein
VGEPDGSTAPDGDDPARSGPVRAERRWPMALAVLMAIVFQVGSPHHGRLPGWWAFPVLEVVLLVVLVVVDPGRVDDRSARARRITVALIAILTAGAIGSLFVMLQDILSGDDFNATNLLGRGAAIWATNVIVFSLWFWMFDRGGPAERAAGSSIRPSFAFPENATPELVEPGWLPRYPDYLFLSFTNAVAFSPTDALPLTTWAKMTMMLESALSLITAILVVARAINVLPA